MQLTKYTDYAFRTLIFLGLQKPAELVTISTVSEHFDIPRNHLVKIVNHLGKLGYIDCLRGKGGGIRLARPASKINLREVVEAVEETLTPINCHKPSCKIVSSCRLKSIVGEAQEAFLAVFAQYHLSDLQQNPQQLEQLLNWYPRPA
ncbi:MAG: Rrf2 family transcriptional regulator [Motiliproteus sp.]